MSIDKDTALNFYALAAQYAHKMPESLLKDEASVIINMTVILGETVVHRHDGDASKFRAGLMQLAALCAIAEQWTCQHPGNAEECPDCSANAAAEERALREMAEIAADNIQNAKLAKEAKDLTLKDFWWTIHGDSASPFGGMIVTRQRSSYAHIPLDAWKLVRARDFGHAVVKAADAANVKG